MRPIPRLVVALALAVLAVVPAAWAADTSLHLVLTPSQKPTDLLAAGEEFGRALGRLVGASVRVTVASDYAAVVEALRNRTADLAFVHPVGYVLANREAKATIVARNLWHGKSSFTSRLFVLHLADGAADSAGARAEGGPEDLLSRGGLLRRPRRVDARAAERSRGRDRVVRPGARAVPRRPRRARADHVGGGDGADPRSGDRRPRRPRPGDLRPGSRRPPPDPRTRLRSPAQAALRDRRVRARRRPRLRSRAGGDGPARRPPALSRACRRMELMIEVAGLSVVLPPDTVALDGIDLAVRAGEFVVILGRSGAGKTTFLRSINRLIDPTAGVIRVAGRAVTGASAAELRQVRRQIGMIFQQFNLVRRASVLDNVLARRLGYVPSLPSLVGRFPAGEQRLALECLAQVGLAHLAGRRADTLSGGEQHRAAIAPAPPGAGGHPRRRADSEPRPAAHVQHHGHPQDHQRGARVDPRREPAPARDGPGLRHAHRRVPSGAARLRRRSPDSHARDHRRDLRRRRGGMRPAALVVGAGGFSRPGGGPGRAP